MPGAAQPDHAAIAAALMQARDSAVRLPLPTAQGLFSLDDAYVVAELTRQQRLARGEQPRGYKIGFTNRGIWPKYGVFAPIWGPVWDSTLQILAGAGAQLSVANLVQPRLEPEVVFGFAEPPRAGMSDAELHASLAWVAHGFEVVHTHFDDWRFAAADTVADFALHGRLFVGPRCAPGRFANLLAELAALQVELRCDGATVDRGQGSAVLGSPLRALRAWLQAMAAQTPHWTLQAGDVVTTGTITDAWPLRPGQRWQTRLSDARLSDLSLEVVG